MLHEGCYIVENPPYKTAYMVHKIMTKTVDVSIQVADWSKGNSPLCPDELIAGLSGRYYRYEKSLLESQVKRAEFRAFTTI